MAEPLEVTKIAIVGAGSMGGGMALLFAENGIEVSLRDPHEQNVKDVLDAAKDASVGDKVKHFKDNASLVESLTKPRILLFSLPHGDTGDTVLAGLVPFLQSGDIIIDAGNEHYLNTERRQDKCYPRGIHYVGMGVSGGYQAARRGPSTCPGGDETTVRRIIPFLEKISAKDPATGKAATGYAGQGGAGHYVKCLHNGIEHGMMSCLSEAFNVMRDGLGMSLDEISDTFDAWNSTGELRNTFLVGISADICRKTDPKTSERVVSTVLDKVVQDMTGEEGTGVWSSLEAVNRHIAAPTLTVAHYLRIASAYRGQREKTNKSFAGGFHAQQVELSPEERKQFLEKLRQAVYVGCLASFVQGLAVIAQANREEGWQVNFPDVWQIWRAGCIIQSEGISELLKPAFSSGNMDLLANEAVVKELREGWPGLKSVIAKGVEADWAVPSLSATLEWMKVVTGTDLPTGFYEAQLDYFGHHMYDKKNEAGQVPDPTEGRYHFEWKPA